MTNTDELTLSAEVKDTLKLLLTPCADDTFVYRYLTLKLDTSDDNLVVSQSAPFSDQWDSFHGAVVVDEDPAYHVYNFTLQNDEGKDEQTKPIFIFWVPAYSPHSLRLSYARWRDLLLKEVDKTCSLVMRARGRSELEEGAIRDKLRRDQREQKAGVLWNSVLPKPTRSTTQPTTPWDIVKAAKQLADVKP